MSRSRSDGQPLRLLSAQRQVSLERLHHLVVDAERRVEGGIGVLQDDADLLAADVLQLDLGHLHEVAAVQKDFAADDLTGEGGEPHERQRQRALAGAAFAHEAETCPSSSVKLTPFTALTVPIRVTKWVWRSRTSSNGGMARMHLSAIDVISLGNRGVKVG